MFVKIKCMPESTAQFLRAALSESTPTELVQQQLACLELLPVAGPGFGLSSRELEVLHQAPAALEALADWHDFEACGANAEGAIRAERIHEARAERIHEARAERIHEARAAELRAEAKRLTDNI